MEHAASRHMVGQACERLRAHDVGRAGFDEFDDLTGEQPSFARLHAERRDLLSAFDELRQRHVGLEAFRCGEGVVHRLLVFLHAPTQHALAEAVVTGAQGVLVPIGGVEVLRHEFHHAGHDCLASLGFNDIHHVVVGVRMIFDEDLADDAHARLARNVAQGKRVEAAHNVVHETVVVVGAVAEPFLAMLGVTMVFDGFADHDVPLAMQLVCRTAGLLVGAHAVDAFEQHVAQDQGLGGAVHERQRDLESGVGFDALRRQCDDRHLRVAGIHERLADESEVVRGAAHATGLGDDKRRVVRVVCALHDCVDELAYDDDRRVARVVVDVFQATFDVGVRCVAQNVRLVTAGAEDSFEQFEVERAHLRTHDRVILLHLLGEGDLVGVFRQSRRHARIRGIRFDAHVRFDGGAGHCVRRGLCGFASGLVRLRARHDSVADAHRAGAAEHRGVPCGRLCSIL